MNEASVLADSNSFLWWMVDRAATISADTYLQDLAARRRAAELAKDPQSAFEALLYRRRDVTVDLQSAHAVGLEDYHYLFLYGLTCDATMLTDPLLPPQLDANYCGVIAWKLLRDPHCATHQAIGVGFMLDRGCRDARLATDLQAQVLERVLKELRWDPRGGDAFLQHLLVLADSPARGRIKPSWLNEALESQLPDGGWDDAGALLHLSSGKMIGVSARLGWRFLRIGEARSNFHTTAQGLLLMSFMLAKDPA